MRPTVAIPTWCRRASSSPCFRLPLQPSPRKDIRCRAIGAVSCAFSPVWFARRWYRNAMPGSTRAFVAFLLLALAGCATLPASVERIESRALADTAHTRLGRAVAPLAAAHPGKSGIHALPNPRDAFAARVLLARAAERSLDLQYYIWHPDTTGGLLAEALWQAAERGVRVRLLLDDANTKGLDEVIAVLDAHPNIEVRLFNPFANRSMRLADFATDFSRVNRRMHNKAFIADNQV